MCDVLVNNFEALNLTFMCLISVFSFIAGMVTYVCLDERAHRLEMQEIAKELAAIPRAKRQALSDEIMNTAKKASNPDPTFTHYEKTTTKYQPKRKPRKKVTTKGPVKAQPVPTE